MPWTRSTGQVSAGNGTVGSLLRDDSLYVRLVGLASGADSLMKQVTQGTASAARLLNDQQSYDQLNKR